MTWDAARRFCQSSAHHGGELASVPDQAANVFLTTLTSARAWIGGTDEGSEGDWRWSDGTPWSYDSWKVNEPNNLWGSQHYSVINHKGIGNWDDERGWEKMPFICQSTPGVVLNNLPTMNIYMMLFNLLRFMDQDIQPRYSWRTVL